MGKFVLGMLLVAAGAVFAVQQAAPIKVVHGRGRNADYRTAVNEALVQAMSQVEGVSLQDSRDSMLDSLIQAKRTNGENVDVNEVRQTLQQKVQATTKGRVLSYDITSERYDKDLAMWYIEVDARVPGQYVVGNNPDNKRRMVVLPFRFTGGEATAFGQKIAGAARVEELARKINENLTQTRRFTMLDRDFSAETKAEVDRIYLDNASARDSGRLNQMLATDYVVIGTVKVFDAPQATVNQYTGMANANDGPFFEIMYRVILAPTTQLKWMSTVVVPYSAAPGSSMPEMIANAFSYAGRVITEEIIANIYPVRVTAKTQFELVLNQGGKNIRQGDAFEVFQESAPVTDVTTGESLGGVEEMIAKIVVTRVTPKMSYAQVVEGTPLASIPIGAVVRRPSAVYVQGAAGGAASPVKTTSGGVIPPWKK